MESDETDIKKNREYLMKKKDIILIIVILLIAGIMYVAVQYAQWGQGTTVKITVDGKIYGTYPMGKYKTIEIKTSKGTNIVEIKDDFVEMKEADCPDKYCVKQGKIKHSGENIVCLPHKVVVDIVSEYSNDNSSENNDNKVDAIVK